MANSIQATAPEDPRDPGGPGDAAGRGGTFAGMPGGLSWTWELDIDAVLAAVRGAAPWQRPPASPGFAGPAPAADAASAADAATDAASAPDTSAAADGGAAGAGAADGGVAAAAPSSAAAAKQAVAAARARIQTARAAAAAAHEKNNEKDGTGGDGEGREPDPEADEAAYQEAVAAGRVRTIPLDLVAGRIAETLPTGPALAAWLGQARAADLEDAALAGIAASFHRMAAWAAAGELAAVAQLASRSARTDRHAETDAAGRPDRITPDAAGQVALALAMSRDGAASWTDLGVVLTWRLPGTGQALAAGQIDLPRARMIARMTTPLTDDQARQVEAAVLGRAGWLTLGQLHAALRRAVITADPGGAEQRRKTTERGAAVAFYPEDEGTATLAGYNLPGVEAAAAMARITALAKAMKLAGSQSQMDLLRVQVFLGLLLGTLTMPATPADPGTPEAPEDPAAPPDGQPPAGGTPTPGGSPSPDDSPSGDAPVPDDTPPPAASPAGDMSPGGRPAPGGEPAPGTPGTPAEPDRPQFRGGLPAACGQLLSWPAVLPHLPWPIPSDGPAAAPSGLLNLAVPLGTLAGTTATTGHLSWLGVITASQARQLGALAARHPATRWRIVIVDPAGQAIAVTHVPRSRSPSRDGPPGISLIRRVTLIVGTNELANAPPVRDPAAPPSDPALGKILDRALTRARRAARDAAHRATADRQAGGCAHQLASPAYRPPPRVAEFVTARDRTCRFGPCRRPAEHCDLDHTRPYDQGGRTCPCNLGGECRTHHQLKQHPRWSLTQNADGEFCWTTPAGRSYLTRPDPYTV